MIRMLCESRERAGDGQGDVGKEKWKKPKVREMQRDGQTGRARSETPLKVPTVKGRGGGGTTSLTSHHSLAPVLLVDNLF